MKVISFNTAQELCNAALGIVQAAKKPDIEKATNKAASMITKVEVPKKGEEKK